MRKWSSALQTLRVPNRQPSSSTRSKAIDSTKTTSGVCNSRTPTSNKLTWILVARAQTTPTTTHVVETTKELNESEVWVMDIDSLYDCILSSLAKPHLGLVAVTAISQHSHISVCPTLSRVLSLNYTDRSGHTICGKSMQAQPDNGGIAHSARIDLGWVSFSHLQPTSKRSPCRLPEPVLV